jgi:hypothetical protein
VETDNATQETRHVVHAFSTVGRAGCLPRVQENPSAPRVAIVHRACASARMGGVAPLVT